MEIEISFPEEHFSEFYALGSNHMADSYPYNVSEGENHLLYLGVSNHLGSSMFYNVTVKVGTVDESVSNATTPSSLPAVYKYLVFLENGHSWEGGLNFSLSNILFSGNSCYVTGANVNGISARLAETSIWNSESNSFPLQMIFELWAYNQTTQGMRYTGLFLILRLNMTSRT